MGRQFVRWLMGMALIGSLLGGCAGNPDTSPTLTDEERTLSSLKQLSADAPLYEMHYYGDYGFAERMRGEQPASGQRATPELEFACSCFAALGDPNERLFGRNFDWYEHPALVLFTDPPEGYASISMVDLHYLGYDEGRSPLGDPDDLLSAPYLPFDGMNEKGLAVGMMAVPHAEGGNDPGKVTLDSLELIRLLLDYAGNVPEALDLMADTNVEFGSVPVHYLIADAQGESALVEYLDGKPVVRRADKPWQVATNFVVAEAQTDGTEAPCPRYSKLYSQLETAHGAIDRAEGMRLLSGVAQGGEYATRWSWVFDLTQRKAGLVFGRDYTQVYEFEVGDDE